MILFILLFILIGVPSIISLSFKKLKIKHIFLSYLFCYMLFIVFPIVPNFEFAFGIGTWGVNKNIDEPAFIDIIRVYVVQHIEYLKYVILLLPLILQLISNKIILGKTY